MSKLPGRREEEKIPSWFLDGQGRIGCTAIGGNPPSTLLCTPPVFRRCGCGTSLVAKRWAGRRLRVASLADAPNLNKRKERQGGKKIWTS